jgi:regulator of cell morphogenesis and NO signaling
LIWVRPQDEPEVRGVFDRVSSMRTHDDAARFVGERLFIETVVRLHRAGEGMPYTGVKWEAAPMDEGVALAESALTAGSLAPVLRESSRRLHQSLEQLYGDVTSTRHYEPGNVEAGRRSVEAYVRYVHQVEALFQLLPSGEGETTRGRRPTNTIDVITPREEVHMFELSSRRVKEIVSQDHRAASVFERHAIDFCCNGGKTLAAACAEKGIDPSRVIAKLETLRGLGGGDHSRPSEWGLDALAEYIVNNHHRYVARMLPQIQAHLTKVVEAHGARHPELREVARTFEAVAAELPQHMQKEEGVLFPYVKALVAAERDGRRMVRPPFGSIQHPIQMMEAEHTSAGDALFRLRKVTGGFAVPADGCATYVVTYRELEEFERDLHQHIHLENNILFPKSIELEERVLDRPAL